jgi:hypothetical protein
MHENIDEKIERYTTKIDYKSHVIWLSSYEMKSRGWIPRALVVLPAEETANKSLSNQEKGRSQCGRRLTNTPLRWVNNGLTGCWPGNLDFLYHSQPRSVASRARCSLSQKATFNYQPGSRHVGICIRSQERGHACWASVLTSSLSSGNRDSNTAQLTTAEDPRIAPLHPAVCGLLNSCVSPRGIAHQEGLN